RGDITLHQRVAIRRRARDRLARDHAAATTLVLDDKSLADHGAPSLRDNARDHVVAATGRDGNDVADRSGRVSLRARRGGNPQKCGRSLQPLASIHHDVSLNSGEEWHQRAGAATAALAAPAGRGCACCRCNGATAGRSTISISRASTESSAVIERWPMRSNQTASAHARTCDSRGTIMLSCWLAKQKNTTRRSPGAPRRTELH